MNRLSIDLVSDTLLAIFCCLLIALGVGAVVFIALPEKSKEYFPMLPQYSVRLDTEQLKKDASSNPIPVETNATETTATEPSTNETIATVPPLESSALAFTPVTPVKTATFFVPPKLPPPKGKPVKFAKTTIKGTPLYLTTIDLKDPEMYMSLELTKGSEQANSADFTNGDESFESFVKRTKGAVVQNGTFFSKDDQKRVMGNMVAKGKVLKYSRWENYGTTLGIKEGNVPEMVTARLEGQPDWSQHWFSITCGPRLLKDGEVFLHAQEEGFADSHVLGVGPRCAIGYNAAKDKLYMVTFLNGLSLQREAELMKALGCSDAMNLDGGASRSLAYNGSIVVPAGRALTNVIVVYDTNHKAPSNVIVSWKDFQKRSN